MRIKLIFLTFCSGTVLILFLIILKPDYVDNDTKLKLKYSHNVSYGNNLPLIVKPIIEPNCDSNLVVWIVTSSASNYLYRTTLRRAYPTELLKSMNVTRIFLLGMPKEKYAWKNILNESKKHNDLLQGDFLDSYQNLTLKHLMGLRWASSECAATFLIKTDDDIVIDIFEVVKFLVDRRIKENALSGYVLTKMKPVRILNSKWFVTKEEFPYNVYPDFLSGWFYVTSLKIAQLLVRTSENFKNLFWIDDVFITGILREKCGIKLEMLNDLYATDYRYLECCIRDKKRKLKCEFIAGPDGGKKELHIKFKLFSEYCQWNCSKRMKEQLVSKTCVSVYEETMNILNSTSEVHFI
ncbi:beta-1,3-galactosyltransferase 5 isoform X1 [Xylocopa sonorina]|uniref:beta-1,3-galactosyltransferase 5 isoform X1 n=1 Tax=Xylocopa sonorina TaxID=1818115 RepID=UPI00403A8BAE